MDGSELRELEKNRAGPRRDVSALEPLSVFKRAQSRV